MGMPKQKPDKKMDPAAGYRNNFCGAIMNWCLLSRQGRAGMTIMDLLLFSSSMGVRADNSSVLSELGCQECHNDLSRAVKNDNVKECACCHDTAEETSDESCIKCHDTEEKPLIFHPIVSYKIPVYWRWLTCSSCHPKRTHGNPLRKSWSAGSRRGNTPVNTVTSTSPETSIIERIDGGNRSVSR